MIVFDVPIWQVLGLLSGTILPLLVGLVTTRVTHSGAKATLLAGLSVLINLATELGSALQEGETYNLGLALVLALGTFLIAVGIHYGLWKPTGVTDQAQDNLRTANTPGQLPNGEHQVVDRTPGPDHRAGS
ncbi:hypothetical protein ACX80U_11995 [Arthrobacter sp. TmT3-37]